jgi:hypothetical protein
MKDKFFWFMAVLLLIPFIASAQDDGTHKPTEVKTHKWSAGAETGFIMYGVRKPDYEFIRGRIGWYNFTYKRSISSYAYSWHTGLNIEMRSANTKFGYSIGVRYINYTGYLGAKDSYDDEFFYVKLKESGTQTDYIRVKSVNQTNRYIGVPVEFRYLPFKPMLFRPYMKLGFDFNFKIKDSSNVNFENNEMDKYEDVVTKMFDEAEDFYSTMYLGFGVKFGRVGKVNLNINAQVPAFVLTGNSAGLVKPVAGGGVNVSVQIPL